MPQVKDESKWGTAALLAKRLIKGSEAGSFKYKLHTVERKLDTKPLPENVPDENYPNGAGGVLSLSPKMSMGGADAFLRLPDRERTFSSRWLIDT